MYIHEEKKTVFIAHPRTASSATGHLLTQLGFKIVGGHHNILPKKIGPDHIVLGTVRNPLDVMVSWYFNQRREQRDFTEWLPVFLEQATIIKEGLFVGIRHCTHILRYETLQSDFTKAMCYAGFQRFEVVLPRRNVSKLRTDQPILDYYTPETLQMVVDHFRQEFIDHKYEIPELA